MNRPMWQRNGRPIFRARRTETIDAQRSQDYDPVSAAVLARAPRMVRGLRLRALCAFDQRKIGGIPDLVDGRRVLRRTAQPPLLSPQPLLLTDLLIASRSAYNPQPPVSPTLYFFRWRNHGYQSR